MMRKLLGVVALAGVVMPCVGQRTWTVRCGSGGPAVDFSDLPQAVAAASPGDTIRVFVDAAYQCATQRYSAVVIDKPLTITGVVGSASSVWWDEALINDVIEIRDLAAGEQVVLRGFLLMGNTFFPNDRGIKASNCAGQIVLDRIRVGGGHGTGDAMARFTDCDDVVIHDAYFRMGMRPVEVVRSNVLMTNVYVGPDHPVNPVFGQVYFNNSPGIRVESGKLTLVSCTITGADHFQPPGMPRQPGVVLDRSVMEVGPDAGVYAGFPWPADSYLTEGQGSSEVHLDARGWIQNLPSPAHAQPMPRDLHATMYGNAAPGETFDYGIAGPPNGFALMVLGAYATSPASSPLGDVWLLPQALSVVANVPLDAQGYHWGSLSVPAGVGSPFVFGLQSLLVGPGGTLEVSRATPFVLGWQSDRLPY